MACSSGCPTPGQHATFGECLRAKSLKVAYCGIGGGDASVQKAWDRELGEFRAATAQGIMPASTKTRDIRKAVEISNQTGKPFRADAGLPPLEG